jgi:hypothetical protein
MFPFEPAWFSTTTAWSSSSESFCPTTRATMSGAPPAGIGTISLIARDGYCASADALESASTHAATRRRTGYFHFAVMTHLFA